MENTIENKNKFYGQYYGQNVLTVGNAICDNTEEYWIEKSLQHTQYLLLKSISSITADEILKISHKIGGDIEDAIVFINYIMNNDVLGNACEFNVYCNEIIAVIDYLRSKSYALSYMGVPVETQIEYGWVKLKEE